uniref:Protein kinase domain-containing protein n=1 Tax=Caenorhabditis japonica TaxID=281687 RepID=A0A8R1DRS0_CAEJA
MKTDWSCTSTVISTCEEKHLTGSHTVYTVEIECSPVAPQLSENFSQRTFQLTTRFKEMAKLHAVVSKLHKQLYLRGVFPGFPPAKLLGNSDPAVIQERRHAIEACLNFLFDSEVLRKARVLHEFVEKAREKAHTAHELTDVDVFYNNSSNILDQPSANSRAADSPSDAATLQPTQEQAGDEFQFPDVAIAEEEEQQAGRKSSMRRLFPKLRGAATQQQNVETETSSPHVDDYLVAAGKLVATAQRAEEEHAYELAFQCYKSAASSLIQGVQIENDMTKRNAVRRKTAKYLVKAEKLYRTHLSLDGSVFNFDGLLTAAMQDPNILAFQCSNKSMKNYRFIGVLPEIDAEQKVILVEETGGQKKKFVMKLIEKGVPCAEGSIFLPTNIPHMVQLVQFFETETHIILLLEHVEPGELWMFLSRMFTEAESRYYDWLCELKADVKDGENTREVSMRRESCEGSYRGRRLLFTVGVDYERVVEMRDESDSTEKPSENENLICTVGEDPTGRSDAPTGDFTLVGHSQQAVESQFFQVEEESPAAVHFDFSTPSPRGNRICSDPISLISTTRPEKENQDLQSSKQEFVMSLWSALQNVRKTLAFRRRVWNYLDLPEALVVHWSAQIVSLIYVLHHDHHEFIGDLNPDDLLIDNDGNLMITYIGRWYETNRRYRLVDGYSAPESTQYGWMPTPDADVWTLGSLMFEMLCGRSLALSAPHGVLRNMELPIPETAKVSFVAKDLLTM